MNERRSDFEWLQEFARAGSQSAFRDIVRRHLDLVYATALRKVGDSGGAQEISQNVFSALAAKAWRFAPDDSLPAWLHKTTLLESKSWLRGELRRRRREQTAAELGTTMKTPDEQPALRALVPLLDEALLSLREKDRTALLLRYYENQSLREVGDSLGVGEDAAQKRVSSALEKLTLFFQRCGYRTATMANMTAILQHTAVSAPSSTTASIMQTAMATSAPSAAGLTAVLKRFVALTKPQKILLCAALLMVPVLWRWNGERAGESQTARKQIETESAVVQETTAPADARTNTAAGKTRAAAEPSVAVMGNQPQQKEYSVYVRGIVEVPDFKAAALEIRHSAVRISNLKVLEEGNIFDDRLIKGAHVQFELARVNSAERSVTLRENGANGSYALPQFLEASSSRQNILLDASLDEVVDLYAQLMGRTVLCHPQIVSSPIFETGTARDRVEAISVVAQMIHGKTSTTTILDGDKFALLVPTNLAASISATLASSTRPAITNDETMPSGTIYMKNLALSQVLPIYEELGGRQLVPSDFPPPGGLISFRSQTPLTKPEAVHAFDVLFDWQGWKVVSVDDKHFKLVRIEKQ